MERVFASQLKAHVISIDLLSGQKQPSLKLPTISSSPYSLVTLIVSSSLQLLTESTTSSFSIALNPPSASLVLPSPGYGHISQIQTVHQHQQLHLLHCPSDPRCPPEFSAWSSPVYPLHGPLGNIPCHHGLPFLSSPLNPSPLQDIQLNYDKPDMIMIGPKSLTKTTLTFCLTIYNSTLSPSPHSHNL